MRRHAPLLLCLVAALVAACGGTPVLDTRTFQLKYIRADQARDIIAPYVYADRPNAKGMMSNSASTITVRETRDNLEKIARVLAQYDQPRPMVRLTFQLIQADGAAGTDPAIADIEAALRKLFRFKGYRLLQQGLFLTAEGADAGQMLGGYGIHPSVARVIGTGDSALVDLAVRLRGPQGQYVDFSARVTVPAGKTAVLGNVGENPKGTLILTVKPELVSASP